MTIQGVSAADTVIDASAVNDRVLSAFQAGYATIENVTLQGGNVTGAGGGIFAQETDLTLNGVVLDANHASWAGGGLFISPDDLAYLYDVTFTGNSAGSKGGGMYVGDNSMVNIANSRFQQNFIVTSGVPEQGGALFVEGNLQATKTIFSDNTAVEGGAVFLSLIHI